MFYISFLSGTCIIYLGYEVPSQSSNHKSTFQIHGIVPVKGKCGFILHIFGCKWHIFGSAFPLQCRCIRAELCQLLPLALWHRYQYKYQPWGSDSSTIVILSLNTFSRINHKLMRNTDCNKHWLAYLADEALGIGVGAKNRDVHLW